MTVMSRHGTAVLTVLALGGCAQPAHPPLIFGQSHTVGVAITTEATDGGGALTIGYRDRDIAIVPVAVEQADGNRTQLDATVEDSARDTAGIDKDAFSVLGQFELTAETGPAAKAGLGKFFATGIAARRLADGFACAMNEGPHCKSASGADASPTNTTRNP